MAEHTPTPWAYRPERHDDWGYIRGPKEHPDLPGSIAAIARGEYVHTHDEHRAAGTDPYAANAAFIVEAVNSYDAMKAELALLRSQVEIARTALAECRTSYCGYSITKPEEQYPEVLADFWRELKRVDGAARMALEKLPSTERRDV